ncbi:hypothetical protein C1646_692743 [Rhizophagus diaphanus]|nr:hypothetical protein C1646_692743 [Rhizophagus diaphanus] [Rhizophagus sp. MUCL 43196]
MRYFGELYGQVLVLLLVVVVVVVVKRLLELWLEFWHLVDFFAAITSTGPENLFPDPSLRARLYVSGVTSTTHSKDLELISIFSDKIVVSCVLFAIADKTPGCLAGAIVSQVTNTFAPLVTGPDGVFNTETDWEETKVISARSNVKVIRRTIFIIIIKYEFFFVCVCMCVY